MIFLKDFVCLLLQLSLLFLFLKDFLVFEVIFICHTLFSLFSVRGILVIFCCNIFLLLSCHHHSSYHSCHHSSFIVHCILFIFVCLFICFVLLSHIAIYMLCRLD